MSRSQSFINFACAAVVREPRARAGGSGSLTAHHSSGAPSTTPQKRPGHARADANQHDQQYSSTSGRLVRRVATDGVRRSHIQRAYLFVLAVADGCLEHRNYDLTINTDLVAFPAGLRTHSELFQKAETLPMRFSVFLNAEAMTVPILNFAQVSAVWPRDRNYARTFSMRILVLKPYYQSFTRNSDSSPIYLSLHSNSQQATEVQPQYSQSLKISVLDQIRPNLRNYRLGVYFIFAPGAQYGRAAGRALAVIDLAP
ncbi:hypothetical protein B0H17DRAFT_1265751 [Mycena rosella]|uniref:Uncharacterized protein n=1 Tax=Mycena rosella TaxID=1033263 RepID=A0AAD7GIZ5_MYCRO|nr:hypothetical protein B0H17DRAFT_1265751 [Mycena rosella]